MSSGSAQIYWTDEIESLAVELNFSKDFERQTELYLKIRQSVLYMIKSLLAKRQNFIDFEMNVSDLETRAWFVLTHDNFDPTKSRMFSWLTKSLWNEITQIFGRHIKNKQNMVRMDFSYAANDEQDFILPDYEPEPHVFDDPKMDYLQQLEIELFWLIPFNFPNFDEKQQRLFHRIAEEAINITREDVINRVLVYRNEILKRIPEAKKTHVKKITKMLGREYQRIKKREDG